MTIETAIWEVAKEGFVKKQGWDLIELVGADMKEMEDFIFW